MVMVATAKIRGQPAGMPSWTLSTGLTPGSTEEVSGIALLRHGHLVAADGRALHEALVLDGIVVGGAVHDGAVVPDDDVALAPGVGQLELRLVGAPHHLVQQRLSGPLRPVDDMAGMGAGIERAAAVHRIVAEQP